MHIYTVYMHINTYINTYVLIKRRKSEHIYAQTDRMNEGKETGCREGGREGKRRREEGARDH